MEKLIQLGVDIFGKRGLVLECLRYFEIPDGNSFNS